MEERGEILALRGKGSGAVVADQGGVRTTLQGQTPQVGTGKVIGLPGGIHQEAFSIIRPAGLRQERNRHLVRQRDHTRRKIHLPDTP